MGIIFIAIFPAALAGLFLESLGGFWLNSKFFITVLIGFISARFLYRVLYGKWRLRHEWLAYSIVFPLLLGAYLWVKEYELIFVLLASFLFAFWILYIREIILDLESTDCDQ